MAARAAASAASCLPMCWVSAPQHPTPSATTTSMPRRVSRRMVASLISGASTVWAHPVSRATRPRRAPWAGCTGGRLRLPAAAGAPAPAPASRAGAWRGAGAARKRPGQPRRAQGEAKQRGARQHAGEHGAQQPIGPGPAIGLFDVGRARDRPGACSSRRKGRWSCRPGSPRQRSTWRTTSAVAGRPDCSMSLIR